MIYVNPVNDEMIADLYAAINGISEITSFYRTDEDRSRDNRVIIDRIYTCAPVSKIDKMMESLISCISQSSLPTVVKAVTAYFYINYIRPFKLFSDEIALLVAKAIIAHESIYDLGAYLPLESLLVDYSETMARISVEVQKTNDITYFVDFAIKFLTQKCDELLDLIYRLHNAERRVKPAWAREETDTNVGDYFKLIQSNTDGIALELLTDDAEGIIDEVCAEWEKDWRFSYRSKK